MERGRGGPSAVRGLLAAGALVLASGCSGAGASPGSAGSPSPGSAVAYPTCPAPTGSGLTYTIGLLDGSGHPSGPQTIADFPHWNDLQGGDVVCIYGRSAPYAERLILTRSGSDDGHRIRIVGVLQGGYPPVLTGKGATTAAAFNYGAELAQYYEGGEVSVTGLDYGAPVAYLNIEGLTIQGATTAEPGGTAQSPTYSVNSYSDPSLNGAAPGPWGCGAAGINLIRCDHISIVHNRIRDNDNGIFVNSNNGNTSSNVTVAYNHIYGNGVGSQSGPSNPGQCAFDSHGVYSEAENISYLANRFGALRQGQAVNLLKDRSSGLVVAYNLFEPDGSFEASLGDSLLVGSVPGPVGHLLDLVESYDPSVGFNTLGEVYDNVVAFGNIFFDDSAGAGADAGTTVPVHFGGDQGDPSVYRHHLHFFNNTVVARRDSSPDDDQFGWFEMETGTDVGAWNNIFYASANATASPQIFTLLNGYCYDEPCGTARLLGQNWNSPLFQTPGVNGADTSPSFVDLAHGDLHIAADDPTIVGNGQAGDAAYPADQSTVPLEYADFLSTVARPFTMSRIDLGAFGYPGP